MSADFKKIAYASWPLVAGVVFALVFLGAWNVYTNSHYGHERKKALIEKLSAEEKLAYWETRVQERGGSAAYRELGEAIHHFGTVRQHIEGHLFGKALYNIEGLNGVATCDNRFMYACYHAFMGQAIWRENVGVAQKLYDACRTTLGSESKNCEHGLGHGVMGTFEYDIDGLKKALAACDALSPPSHMVAGCHGGVFMEYSLRFVGNEGAVDMRPFTPREILEPCSSLSEPYLGSCAHWQTQWWIMAAPDKKDGLKMAKNMGAWCAKMPGGKPAYRLCLEGIARRMKSLTGGKPEKTAEFCTAVTSTDYQYSCQAMSAKRFAYYYPLSKAILACDGLPSDQLKICRDRATAEDKRLLATGGKYAQQTPDVLDVE